MAVRKKRRGKKAHSGGRGPSGKNKKSKVKKILAWLRSRKKSSGKKRKHYEKKNKRR